jgi:fibronectin type 3 domain-containing protein
MSRTVTDITWSANPANDAIAPILKYRIYRKKPSDDDAYYAAYAEVSAGTFSYRDRKVSAPNTYVYGVSAIDAAGHESPLGGAPNNSVADMDAKIRATIRKALTGIRIVH